MTCSLCRVGLLACPAPKARSRALGRPGGPPYKRPQRMKNTWPYLSAYRLRLYRGQSQITRCRAEPDLAFLVVKQRFQILLQLRVVMQAKRVDSRGAHRPIFVRQFVLENFEGRSILIMR